MQKTAEKGPITKEDKAPLEEEVDPNSEVEEETSKETEADPKVDHKGNKGLEARTPEVKAETVPTLDQTADRVITLETEAQIGHKIDQKAEAEAEGTSDGSHKRTL